MNIWEIGQALILIWIVFKLMLINHNQSIIVDNQKTINKNLTKIFNKDKSILDNLFKEK